MLRNQSAYRRLHSTESVLTVVFSDIIQALDSGGVVLLSLLDLSAAFDCVDHDILLARLRQSYGFDSSVYDWLSSYLSERSQHVRCGRISTAPQTIKYGVPQGSVLGSLLFVLYTADIGRIIQSHGLSSHFYADDTQTYIFAKPDNLDILREATVSCIDEIAI